MNSITIFTIDVYNNNYFSKQPCVFCIKSWKYLIKNLEYLGYDVNVKLYTNEHQDYKDYYKLCKNWVDHNLNKPELIADGFRIYILSKYANHLWLDTDLYFHNDFNFENRFIFSYHWCYLYNKDNLEFFKNILTNFYCNEKIFNDNPDLYNYNDRKVSFYINCGWDKPKMLSKTTHMSFVNNYSKERLKFCNTENTNFNKFDFDGILIVANDNIRAKFVDIFGIEKTRKYVRNLRGNIELLYYIKNQFPDIKIID